MYDPRPKDNKTWFLAAHCGDGTLDDDEFCGFCGETHAECAKRCTEHQRDHMEQVCGGSGFWCYNPGCGRFWGQNSCGECDNDGWYSQDGAEVRISQGYVLCVCGQRLYRIPGVC